MDISFTERELDVMGVLSPGAFVGGSLSFHSRRSPNPPGGGSGPENMRGLSPP